jgi:hypothetical protein
MFAVMLIFAFTMSAVISYAEKVLRHQDEERMTGEPDPEEIFATRQPARAGHEKSE